MQKTLAVFGATGHQGGSVIRNVQSDSELAKQYQIRAITRDLTKSSSTKLKEQGIEVVEADANDAASLVKALTGCQAVFIVTSHDFMDTASTEREITQGKSMADAAVTAGVELIIFSSLRSVTKVSGGKYQHVGHFDAKAKVEEYIRTLPVKSAFVALASYMQNFREALVPRPLGDGTFAFFNCMTPETKFAIVDVGDTGKWVAAILAAPEKFDGEFVAAATEDYTMNELAEIMSRASGKTVRYNQVPEQVYRGFLPPTMVDDLVDMALYFQDFGYYGPNSNELVSLAPQKASTKPTTFEEFFMQNPLVLD
ncbi:hypothetical protein V494_06492 [Pseudogymnoascus sp. VKM F-4513 (FW-928)]|nr:hypothetical protein V494_06492 [Pseudogymnoascus sp. VKM F-4513 (FW-928)]